MPLFDQENLNWLFGFAHRSPFGDTLIFIFAHYLTYILVVAFFFLIFQESGWRRRFLVFGEAALATLLARGLIAEAFYFAQFVPRPYVELGLEPLVRASGSAFPSGHASFLFALGLAVWYANRRWGWWYLGGAALVVVARVLAIVHWPLDIVAGSLIGLFSAFVTHRLLGPQLRALRSNGERTH